MTQRCVLLEESLDDEQEDDDEVGGEGEIRDAAPQLTNNPDKERSKCVNGVARSGEWSKNGVESGSALRRRIFGGYDEERNLIMVTCCVFGAHALHDASAECRGNVRDTIADVWRI